MRFHFQDGKATEAASRFLSWAGEPLPHMTLNRLLFLADRQVLQQLGCTMTGDRFVATAQGPALDRIYRIVTSGLPRAPVWNQFLESCAGSKIRLRDEPFDGGELSQFDSEILDGVFHEVGHLDQWGLAEWVRANVPEWSAPKYGVTSIPYEATLRAFSVSEELIEQFAEEALMHWEIRVSGCSMCSC